MNETKSCWGCKHRPVCKFWAAVADKHFAFSDDSKIGPLMSGVALVFAEACAWYEPVPDETPKPAR